MGHEVIGCIEETAKESSRAFQNPGPVLQSSSWMKMLVKYSSAFPPSVAIAHKNEVPITADAVMR